MGLIQMHRGILLFILCLSAACGGPPLFRVTEFAQDRREDVRLNEVLRFRFNREIDPSSLHQGAIRLQSASGAPAKGEWIVKGSELLFSPSLPFSTDGSDAGLEPDTRYSVRLEGFPAYSTLLSTEGERLKGGTAFSFRTIGARGDVSEWFVDPEPGIGPMLLEVGGRSVARIGMGGIEVRPDQALELLFSEPIFPESVVGQESSIYLPGGGGIGSGEGEWLPLRCKMVRHDSVSIEPEGGFRNGCNYKLLREFLGFTDFGGNRIEEIHFEYIWISCKNGS